MLYLRKYAKPLYENPSFESLIKGYVFQTAKTFLTILFFVILVAHE